MAEEMKKLYWTLRSIYDKDGKETGEIEWHSQEVPPDMPERSKSAAIEVFLKMRESRRDRLLKELKVVEDELSAANAVKMVMR